MCDSEEIRSSSGHVMVQVVSRWSRAVNARVVTRAFLVRFMVKEVAMRQISIQALHFSPCQYHSTNVVYTFSSYYCSTRKTGDRGSTVVKVLCYKSESR